MYEVYRPWKTENGALIPNWLICRNEISPTAKLVYARLRQFAGENWECYPKQTTLANEIGIGERQVRRALAELEKLKLIKCTRNGKKMNNTYEFLRHPWLEEAKSKSIKKHNSDRTHMTDHNSSDRTHMTGSDRTHMSYPYKRDSYEEIHIKKYNKKNTQIEKSFEKFWTAYPVKKSKQQAIKSFSKINPDHEKLNQILESLDKQKIEREKIIKLNENRMGKDKIFLPPWKYPATWLNGGCWDDEIEKYEGAYHDEKKDEYRPKNDVSNGMGEIWSNLAEDIEYHRNNKQKEGGEEENLLSNDIWDV